MGFRPEGSKKSAPPYHKAGVWLRSWPAKQAQIIYNETLCFAFIHNKFVQYRPTANKSELK